MTVPGYLIYYVLGGSIGILAAVLFALRRAVERAGWPDGERKRTLYATASMLLGWFAVAVLLASFEVYRPTAHHLPTIQYGIALPILVGGLMIWRSSALSRLIDAVPQQWVVAIQGSRVLGIILLVLYASHRLPGIFAWPAGTGDVLVGLLAPLVARAASRRAQSRFSAVLLWNLFGLADLIVAVGTGFFSSPSPLQLFAFDQPNELISVFPLVLIPTFLVPLLVLLHLVSLVKLARAKGPIEPRFEFAGSRSPSAE